ncbi:MAG: hypothetical protein EX271_05370 [Acidimicrobiales bacterium]|nr:hypothetical protein [Hyphomonadaceae bacterium]RZV42690.1 MAG: hypothetical protein EX271_05370 [Acidimicrobiales bacterium]
MLNHKIIEAFAQTRHQGLSFPFLKENGELLSISAKSGLAFSPASLDLYRDLYNNALNLCEIYPQFFRFFLGITLDLETLGMQGNMGDNLVKYVLDRDLYSQETSDTRRLEIINMLAMKGKEPNYHSDPKDALVNRVRTFFSNPNQFVKFNKPLFYELTHIVFFLTDFGKRDFEDCEALIKTLTNVGLIAFLDDDTDLLSEVCLCFSYLKTPAPEIWKSKCANSIATIKIRFVDADNSQALPPVDEYHAYIVINWLIQSIGGNAFAQEFKNGVPIFEKTDQQDSPLAVLSHKLHDTKLSFNGASNSEIFVANTFMNEGQINHTRTAISSVPTGPAFFNKLTHGSILLA